MKKILILFVFALISNLGFSQAEDFKKDALRLIEVGGSSSQIKQARKQILQMIPQEKQAAFIIEFDSSLPPLYDKMADALMTEYTHDEVKEILKFYDSPIGKKMTAKNETLGDKYIASTQEWAMGLQSMMMKYME